MPKPNSCRHSGSLSKLQENYDNLRMPQSCANPRTSSNAGKRSLFFSVKEGSQLVAAIDQLVYILDKEMSKTIIKIESSIDSVVERLKNSSLKPRLLYEENLKDVDVYLEKNDKILVVTSKGDTFLKGSDVPVLVVITKYIDRTLSEKIFSRCKSKLVVVCHEEYALRIVPSNETTDYAKLISVYETLIPHDFEEAVKNDNLELLRTILRREGRFLVDARNVESKTGLMIACCQKAERPLNVLMNYFCDKKHPDLYAVDSHGLTAIHYAAKSGSVNCLQILIKSVMRINEATRNEALQLATEENHEDVISFLKNIRCSFIDRLLHVRKSHRRSEDHEMMEYQTIRELKESMRSLKMGEQRSRERLEEKRDEALVGTESALATTISLGAVGLITGGPIGLLAGTGLGVIIDVTSHIVAATTGLTGPKPNQRRNTRDEPCILS